MYLLYLDHIQVIAPPPPSTLNITTFTSLSFSFPPSLQVELVLNIVREVIPQKEHDSPFPSSAQLGHTVSLTLNPSLSTYLK